MLATESEVDLKVCCEVTTIITAITFANNVLILGAVAGNFQRVFVSWSMMQTKSYK